MNKEEYFLEIAAIELLDERNSLLVWAENIPNIHSGQNLDIITPLKIRYHIS